MPNITLSVIIPVYNRSDSLLAAIASVEACQDRIYEIIIVDDGSTDLACLKVLDYLTQKGYRVIHQTNTGVSHARNRAIQTANGKYILPLDDDNMLRPRYMTEGVKILDQCPEVGVVYGDAQYFGDKTERWVVGEFDLQRLLMANYIDNCAVYRREIWDKTGGYDPNLKAWEDYDLWLSAIEHQWKFHYIPEIMFDYCVHTGSLSAQMRNTEQLYAGVRYITAKHASLFTTHFAHVNATRARNETHYYNQTRTLQTQSEALKTENAALLAKQLVLQEANTNTNQQFLQIKNQLQQSEDAKVELQQYAALLYTQLNNTNENNTQLQQQITTLSAQSEEQTGLISQLQRQSIQLQTQLEVSNEANTQLYQHISDLQTQLKASNEVSDKLHQQITYLHTQLDVSNLVNNQLQQRITSLHTQLDEANKTIVSLQQLITQLQTQLKDNATTNDQQKQQLMQLRHHLTLTTHDLEIMVGQRDHWQYEWQKAVYSFESSRSWRVTAPLRALQNTKNRLRYAIRDRKWAREIAASKLFDAQWYCQTYPDVTRKGINPALHYLRFGGFEGRNPSAHFDSAQYLSANPDVVAIAMNPLLHWLRHGANENRPRITQPRLEIATMMPPTDAKNEMGLAAPTIETPKTTLENNKAQTSNVLPFFDAEWYWQQYPEVRTSVLDPLSDYLLQGWQAGRDPNPFFNVKWYLMQIKESGELCDEPLQHYLSFGWHHHSPHPFFDGHFYNFCYPDVVQNKLEPLTHYILHGCKERRSPNNYLNHTYLARYLNLANHGLTALMPINRNEGRVNDILATGPKGYPLLDKQALQKIRVLDNTKDTIMIVTHAMSRTGAPILAWNLVKALKKKFQVLVFALKEGELAPAFAAVSDLVITIPPTQLSDPSLFAATLQQIKQYKAIKFAIVNSVEASDVLEALWLNDIPSIHLIHEFATNTHLKERFLNSARFAGQQIYSAKLVLENVLDNCRELKPGHALIVPQAACKAPINAKTDQDLAAEKHLIRTTLRPSGFAQDGVVIIGMGSAHLRKGVDLFIECAKQTRNKHPQYSFRFVWIGDGYNPIQDMEYSAYLDAQIKHSGLDHIVVFLGSISEVETAYQEADIFFLSSRLDPLPQVAQDALIYARPLVCFRDTTGIVEYLENDPLAAYGVVPYLDLNTAADRLYDLINDATLRDRVGRAGKAIADRYFQTNDYIHTLEQIGLAQAEQTQQAQRDCQIIANSGLFDYEYFFSPLDPRYRNTPIKYFVKSWQSGLETRKPLAGFHPSIYAARHPIGKQNAFAHYLTNHTPNGPWRYDVIEATPNMPEYKSTLRIGLHLHIYFTDIANEIFERLKKVQSKIDLLISVPNEEIADTVKKLLRDDNFHSVDIRIVPNRGRDIGPFLTEFGKEIVSNYDIIGHLHTKKSLHWPNQVEIKLWRRFILENLLGGQYPMADTILARLQSDKTIGIVFPDDPNVLGWDKNRETANDLAKKLNLQDLLPETAFNFPVGSMFWAKTDALKPLFDLNLGWSDYPEEPAGIDSTILHALERLLPFVAQKAGYKTVLTHVKGVSR